MKFQSRQFYLLPLVLCTALFAGEKGPTSFLDGTWKINAAKSDGGPRGLPDDLSVKVTTKGPEFEGLQRTGDSEILLKFRSDGKEAVNQLPNDVEMRSKHRVENGAVLADYARTTHLSAPRMVSQVKRPPPSGVTTSRPRA